MSDAYRADKGLALAIVGWIRGSVSKELDEVVTRWQVQIEIDGYVGACNIGRVELREVEQVVGTDVTVTGVVQGQSVVVQVDPETAVTGDGVLCDLGDRGRIPYENAVAEVALDSVVFESPSGEKIPLKPSSVISEQKNKSN